MKINRCPYCEHPTPWVVRIHPLQWIFTKYYIECRICHCCGPTKIGKNRAIKAWNKWGLKQADIVEDLLEDEEDES